MLRKNEHNWLLDAEVQSRITEKKGRWEVSLIFINTKNPNEFLIRVIADYRSKNLAEICARQMQQTAARDPRGTQKLNVDAYDINHN